MGVGMAMAHVWDEHVQVQLPEIWGDAPVDDLRMSNRMRKEAVWKKHIYDTTNFDEVLELRRKASVVPELKRFMFSGDSVTTGRVPRPGLPHLRQLASCSQWFRFGQSGIMDWLLPIP